MTFSRSAVSSFVLSLLACGPPPLPPGVSSEAFDGPGDKLSQPELSAFVNAANAIHGDVVSCIETGYHAGVRSSEVVARIRFHRDGQIYAVGFKNDSTDDGVNKFLGCMRRAIATMDLHHGPWESDHAVVYRFTTEVRTTWE